MAAILGGMKPERLLPLLRGGLFRDTRWGWVKLLRPMLLGEVELGPGGLVVADPWSLHRTDALPAPAGRHAVFALTEAQEYGPEASGLAVRFHDATPVRWEAAMGLAKDGRPWAVPVDSAAIAVASAEVCAAWAKRVDADFETLVAAMESEAEPLQIGEGQAFRCRLGSDGGYAPWWGYDAEGRLSWLVVGSFGEEGEWAPWPEPPAPGCPLDDPLAMLRWVETMTAPQPLIESGRMPEAQRAALLERAGVDAPPPSVALFWDHFDPGEIDTWAAMEPEIRGAHGPCLPLEISGSATIVQLEAPFKTLNVEGGDRVWGIGVDPPSYFATYAIVAWDLAKG